MNLKKLFLICAIFCAFTSAFADDESSSLGETITDLKGHRFVEVRAAAPVFPVLTSHGAVQSFVVGFADVFGAIFSGGEDYDACTPKLATDLNLTIFPPMANHRLGFMAGVAIDEWNWSRKQSDGTKKDETFSMNFYYLGFHGDYGHWVFSDIGTRLSLYGEVALGWIASVDSSGTDYAFCFDVCPLGIQFCPQKNIGLYMEFPHLGARPFLQMGVSVGF